MTPPGPEDVAAALRAGTPPSTLTGDSPSAATTGAAGPSSDAVSGGGLTVEVHGAALLQARDSALAELRRDRVAEALLAGDATVRGGWLDTVDTGRALLPDVLALRDELRAEGVDRVVLCGVGGSSLAPEVLCGTAGVPLVVLDSTDPGQVRTALAVDDEERLSRTVVVVSSTSGRTIETDSHRRAARAALEATGIDPAERVVVVTDPGSPLAEQAGQEGVRALFLADPDVGGRYSALTAFGLVPAGLAGADVGAVLDDAAALHATLGDGGPALALGAVLGAAAVAGRDKLVLAPSPSLVGFGSWVEHLVVESTGRDGKGILPVVVEAPDAPGTEPAADTHLVVLAGEPEPTGTVVSGPLGAQLMAWEHATAVAGRLLRIDPSDQPDVQESQDLTGEALAGRTPPMGEPLLVQDGVEVSATGDLLAEVSDLAGALAALLAAVPDRGYLAVMAYLDRGAEAEAAQLRPALAARVAHPVTFGWGPRFLHSTGQYHKGGPQTGAFLQVTAAIGEDLDVPGRDFTFGRLQSAQARGDLGALAARGRPVLRLHLTDRVRGLRSVLAAAKGAGA